MTIHLVAAADADTIRIKTTKQSMLKEGLIMIIDDDTLMNVNINGAD
jgi:hypothetical protein